MADAAKTVFLSYRREISWPLAIAVRGALDGFDVFLDTHDLGSGEFERVILREIEVRMHFLLLLEPRSLDGITEEGDWLRREIAHALAHGRNVVPLLANGARMPRARDLPADMARLPVFNAVSVPHDYFPAAMQKLRERFLRSRAPVRAVPPPITPTVIDEGSSLALPPRTGIRAFGRPPWEIRLTARVESTDVDLRWTAVRDATTYVLERALVADFEIAAECYRGPAIGFRDTSAAGIIPLTKYYYRVRADVGRTAGPWSKPVQPT
jgi:hypothetical protein